MKQIDPIFIMDSLTINMIFGYQYTKVQNCEYVPPLFGSQTICPLTGIHIVLVFGCLLDYSTRWKMYSNIRKTSSDTLYFSCKDKRDFVFSIFSDSRGIVVYHAETDKCGSPWNNRWSLSDNRQLSIHVNPAESDYLMGERI